MEKFEVIIVGPSEIEKQETKYEVGELSDDFEDMYPDLDENKRSRLMKEFLDYLDSETAVSEDQITENSPDSYTSDDFKNIWENDYGFLNEKSFKSLPKKENLTSEETLSKDSLYIKYGVYKDFHNYHKDSVDGTEDTEFQFKEGMVIERHGSVNGKYFHDEGVEFSQLHMNYSEDKAEKHRYAVIKDFDPSEVRITKSVIADQEFDEMSPDEYKETFQYKSSLSVQELIEKGYIKEI